MSLISLVGILTLILKEKTLKKIILPLVSFSAGSLIGGAFFHLIPEGLGKMKTTLEPFLWLVFGFSVFFLLEQFVQWHHCHRVPSKHKKPVTYLILIADGLHNFFGGLAIASSFLISIPAGITTWIACAAHEIPQELGDFGILIHGGWKKYKALLLNLLSAMAVVLGGLFVFLISTNTSTAFLLPFSAGNFIYIASSDLIPEIKHGEKLKKSMIHFVFFVLGLLVLLGVKLMFI